MKIQIISKFIKNQLNYPHSSPHHYPNQPNKQNQHPNCTNNDYYENNKRIKTSNDLQKTNRENINHFFSHFQNNCTVIYEKVQLKSALPSFKRKLQLLAYGALQSPTLNDYEFSFKKKESIKPNHYIKQQKKTSTNSINTMNTIQLHLSSPKDNHYLPRYLMNEQTIKIRKFNSLAAIKTQHQDHCKVSNRHPKVHFHSSFTKKQTSLSKINRFYGKKIENHKTQASEMDYHEIQDYNNAEEIKIQNNKNHLHAYGKQKMKTQINFEEEKQRLFRIRKELNDIYQMKKVIPNFKLKLY